MQKPVTVHASCEQQVFNIPSQGVGMHNYSMCNEKSRPCHLESTWSISSYMSSVCCLGWRQHLVLELKHPVIFHCQCILLCISTAVPFPHTWNSVWVCAVHTKSSVCYNILPCIGVHTPATHSPSHLRTLLYSEHCDSDALESILSSKVVLVLRGESSQTKYSMWDRKVFSN